MQHFPSLEKSSYTGSFARWHNILYRTGFILQVLGAGVLAILYPLDNPFFTVGIMIFELGTLLAGMYLPMGTPIAKALILGSVVTGITVQVAGFYVPEQYAVTIFIAGIGLVGAGAAGIAGRESYSFGFREGRILAWLYPAVIVLNLTGLANHVINAVAFSAAFVFNLYLTGSKLRQPFLTSYPPKRSPGQ